MLYFFRYLFFFISFSMQAGPMCRIYEAGYRKALSRKDFYLYIIDSHLIILGYSDTKHYSQVLRIAKRKFAGRFFDFVIIESVKNNIDQKKLENYIKQKYLFNIKFTKCHIHLFDGVLYIIAPINSEYEKKFLFNLEDLIKEDQTYDIKKVVYCLI